ncbi:unnamed protein product [Linum tenue]|uniref:Uncharacterized protein n=1 Tax=Linum tenue TaxID=586396 RepID=A0AAV0LZR2_9ROSI|nr:unnamed protein product [Linum tenue]
MAAGYIGLISTYRRGIGCTAKFVNGKSNNLGRAGVLQPMENINVTIGASRSISQVISNRNRIHWLILATKFLFIENKNKKIEEQFLLV